MGTNYENVKTGDLMEKFHGWVEDLREMSTELDRRGFLVTFDGNHRPGEVSDGGIVVHITNPQPREDRR